MMRLFGYEIVDGEVYDQLFKDTKDSEAGKLRLIDKLKDMTANADACASNLKMTREDNNTLVSKLAKANAEAMDAKVALATLRSEIEDTKTSVKPGRGQAALLKDAPAKPNGKKSAKRKTAKKN